MKLLSRALAVAIVAATPTLAANERRVALTVEAVAVPANSPIVLDGRFNEEVWQQAPPITEFQQREPAEGQPPTLRTEARMVYDDTSLYVAVRAFDNDPDKLVGILTRRDQRSPSDWIRIVVDSYFDRRSAYEFGVNPVGVKTDRYYFNDGQSDDSWDAVWDVHVERDGEGWRAEFKIPFSQLRFNTLAGGPVGFAVIREVGRLAETASWPLLSRNANGFVSQFGELRGLRMAGAPKRFELLPYSVADLRTQPHEAGNPLSNPTDPGAALGLDMKYAVTPGLTLTATANPDFGQVEADPAVVNLDAFETFFPERRPFFVEGSGTFRFNMDCNDGNCTGMFYSRRIGRAPQGWPELADDEHATQPDTATIIGAGKLTGRIGGFSIGALTAVTAREDAEIAGGSTIGTRASTVEPMTGYTVLRARKEFANQSSLGFMTTSTNRQLDPATAFLPANAYAGGIDYDWRLSPMYNVSGYWAASHIEGSPAAITRLQENTVHGFQRPDAGYVDVDAAATALRGHAGSISVGKIAGETIRFNSFVGYKSPGFDTNDLGFMRRADERNQSNWIQWRNFRPGKYVRTRNVNFNQYQGWNFGGDRTYSGANINSHWTFTNYYGVGGGFNIDAAPFRDRVTRGGPGVLGNPGKNLWYNFGTDHRKALQFMYFGGHWADNRNSERHDINPGINWRATASISLNVGLRYFINRDDSQWVTNENRIDGGKRHVFARIDQTTMSFPTRFNYTMTPNLSLQVYAEPFVSSGDYTNYKELVDGRADRYEDRYRPYRYSGNANFNIRSFRTTNVVRWEYKPGSTLFVVWQQNRSDSLGHGDFRFGRDFGGVFSAPGHNTFLVKFSYWLNI